MASKVNDLLINYLWNNSSLICLIINKDGFVQHANAYAGILTGKDLIGMSINEIFVHFDKPMIVSDYLTQPLKKEILNIETSKQLPSSYYFQFYELDNSVLALGEANSMEIELMRNTLLELNGDLNNLTRELQKRNVELKKVNDLKDQFLGIAAHDLRNPVGLIQTFSEFLFDQLHDKISTGQLKMLNAIKLSSEFIVHLLEELLDISVIESGKLTINYEKVNLVELIKQNVELNNNLASKKNILINFDCYEIIPVVQIDKIKIEQVLNNLISNAIKYSFPVTQIKVSIRSSQDNIVVAITDQGQGIPENEIENIFKPFVKTSVKSTANERSTGLGLAIVWNIIKGHKGNIWVESKVGKGSTFYFSIPYSNN